MIIYFLDGQIAKGFGRSARMNDDTRLLTFYDNLNLLSLINGRYIYSPVQMNHPDLVFQDRVDLDNGANQIYYYENKAAYPRIYLSHSLHQFTGSTSQLVELLTHPNYSAFDRVYQTDGPFLNPIGIEPDGDFNYVNQPSIRLLSDTLIELDVQTDKESILVISDNHLPGWHATVSGKDTPVFEVNLVNKGIVIPPGTHFVQIYYDNIYNRYGFIGTLISLLVLLMITGGVTLVNRRKP